jgi:ATP-binding cassette, subfamily B, multidrug efflux pump
VKVVLEYMKKYAGFYLIGVAAMLCGIVLDMFNPYMVKRIIDEVIIGRNMAPFKGIVITLIGITVGRAILGYTKEYMFDLSSSNIIIQVRKRLFDHIQTLSFSFFDRNNTGELMSRIKEDTENVMHAICFGIMLFMEQAIYFVIAVAVLFKWNWKLALVSIAIMPVIAYIALQLEKKIGATYDKISDQRAVLNTTAQENLAGVRLVKAFGRERHEIQKFLDQNKESYRLNVEQASVWSRYQPQIEFFSNIVIVLVTSVGGFLVIGKEMSIGTMVAYCNYVYMLIWPMRLLGWLINVLAQCMASIKKIDKLFEEQPEIKSPENAVKPENIQGHVVFENVSLEYSGISILQDITIDAKPGSTVAIMGATGSGKSSVINLIGRYYDCSSGRVLVDGIDVKDMDLQALRKGISVVMQDTFLFSDSIEENIRFGSGASVEELIQSAKDAHVHEFVMKTTKGYETVIGERGIGLSGGQKQRISIARSLVRNSGILVLDDSTSALDMETEHEIQKALEQRKGMTKFIIAHRVSAVKNADEIIILDNGKIVERGTHQELLEQKGRYYDTYVSQFQGLFADSDEEVG